MNTRRTFSAIALASALAALSCGDKQHETAPATSGRGSVAASAAAAGSSADKEPMSDPRCPAVELPGAATLPSCCDPNGQCGINPAMFGTPGCIDLATAKQEAEAFGTEKAYPSPRACDSTPDTGK
jgi:hypothetical protein